MRTAFSAKNSGFAVKTPQSVDCILALAELRQRHVDLLVSYSWL